jgi:hypothetical protein
MRRWPLYAFVGWTILVWIGRIGLGGDPLLAGPFVVLAVVTLWRRGRWVYALAVWTAVVWGIRTPAILVHDHPVTFKAVHGVLAVVSVALAVLAVSMQRDVERQREAATAPARL